MESVKNCLLPLICFSYCQVPVGAPSEIEEIFDTITYNKGSCIVRMLHDWIGTDVRSHIHLLNPCHYYFMLPSEFSSRSLQLLEGFCIQECFNWFANEIIIILE